MHRLLLGLSCLLAAGCQAPSWRERRLSNNLRILCVAAHPDDEDGALLLWHHAVAGADSMVLYTTRGEGGQNAIGPQLYRELGVIREDEIAAACEVYGARPYFAGFDDFGFSKRADETFERWGGQDQVVQRFTYFLRKLRPHRVFTNHTPERGHGHHRATSIALRQAVVAAADPRRYPEQLRDGALDPWTVDGLFERVFASPPDGEAPPSDEVLTLDYGDDTPDGRSVARVAYEGFVRHASQGPWPAFGERFRGDETRYHLVWSAAPGRTPGQLPDYRRSLPIFEDGEADSDELWDLWENPASHGFEDEERLAGELRESLGLVPTCEVAQNAIELGGELEATLSMPSLDEALAEQLEVRLHGPATLQQVARESFRQGVSLRLNARVDDDAPYTVPRHEVHYGYLDRAERYPLRIELKLSPPGRRPLITWVDVPLDLAPPLLAELAPAPIPVLRERLAQGAPAQLRIQLPTEPTPERLQVSAAPGTELLDGPQGGPGAPGLLQVAPDTRQLVVPLVVRPAEQADRAQIAVRSSSGARTLAEAPVRILDLQVPPALHVAFVAAQDRSCADALRTLGIQHQVVEPSQLADLDLDAFSNVILDVRLLGRSEEVRAQGDRLRRYIEGGGHVLCMYHKSFEWNPHQANGNTPSPFALELTNSRVCEERAPVQILDPEHP